MSGEQMAGSFAASVEFFIGTFSELLILFVLISMLVFVLQDRSPANRIQALLSGGRGYFTAAALGAITPFCSCSTLPMLVGMLRANAAFGPVMTFLLTSPLLNPVQVGAVIHGYVPADFFKSLGSLNSWLLIPVAALIGIPLYVRASSMIPLALSLVGKGMSYGSVMALTIGGAGASLPEMIILKRIFQWPLLLAFIGVVFLTACITGVSIDTFLHNGRFGLGV